MAEQAGKQGFSQLESSLVVSSRSSSSSTPVWLEEHYPSLPAVIERLMFHDVDVM